MVGRVLFFLLVIFAGSVAHAEGTVKEGQVMASRILGKNVEFTLYLPPGFGRDERRYPVIYLCMAAATAKIRIGIVSATPTSFLTG